MTVPLRPPFFLWSLFEQLRRRGFAIGLGEYEALRQALRAGFGLAGHEDLRAVCTALWAKSPAEQAVVAALFDQHVPWKWRVTPEEPEKVAPPLPGAGDKTSGSPGAAWPAEEPAPRPIEEPAPPTVAGTGRLPVLMPGDMPVIADWHVFLPQFPVNFRAVAQTWRRLRRPVREGPAIELDVDATVRRRSAQGVVCPPVLRPRRRNSATLLLLVDRQGSMAPFHAYVDEVCEAIRQGGGLRSVETRYFHDTPVEGADPGLLSELEGRLFPELDPVLAAVPALTDGFLLTDPELAEPVSILATLERHARGAAVVIFSDAGAARGRHDLLRVLDTLGFAKGLLSFTRRIVWLNPLPERRWAGTTAAQIARHLPMFAMTAEGMHRAVNVLRGQPAPVTRPLHEAGERG